MDEREAREMAVGIVGAYLGEYAEVVIDQMTDGLFDASDVKSLIGGVDWVRRELAATEVETPADGERPALYLIPGGEQ